VIAEEEHFDLHVVRAAHRYQDWVLSAFGDGLQGDILEVGGGIGNFSRWLARRARKLTVVEPDPGLARELAALELPGCEIVERPIEALDGESGRFDSVVMINVLEHIEDDVRALRIAHSLLRPGGSICVLVPAHRALFGSLDARYGHLRRYTRSAVCERMSASGFSVRRCTYFNPMGAVGWFLISRVARRPRLSRAAVVVAEGLAVPIGRALGRIGPPPFGQSVLAVGVRGSSRGLKD
jgi:SAM-dependent methyltransferase